MPPGRGAEARLRDPQQARTLCPACPSLPSWTLVQVSTLGGGPAASSPYGITKLTTPRSRV